MQNSCLTVKTEFVVQLRKNESNICDTDGRIRTVEQIEKEAPRTDALGASSNLCARRFYRFLPDTAVDPGELVHYSRLIIWRYTSSISDSPEIT